MLHSGQSFEMLLVTHTDISFISRYTFCLFLLCCVSLLGCISKYTHTHLLSITAVLFRHWWGTSGAGFFFRVSMIDWTPRFTLDVTRRVTESLGAGAEEPVFPRHFWYRNYRKHRIILVWFYVLVCTQMYDILQYNLNFMYSICGMLTHPSACKNK